MGPRCLPAVIMLLLAFGLSCGDTGGGPASFRVVNETDSRVYLQVSPPGAYWLLSRDGQKLRAIDGCEACNCADRKCYVCGLSLGQVEPIEPGASHAWAWDGRAWRTDGVRSGGVGCENSSLVSSGPLQLNVTYGQAIKETVNGTNLDGQRFTVTRDFMHPEDSEIEISLR